MAEAREAADDIDPEALSFIGFKTTAARIACYGGRVAEAVALYDELIEKLEPRGPLIGPWDGNVWCSCVSTSIASIVSTRNADGRRAEASDAELFPRINVLSRSSISRRTHS